jgi:hypothetical protein
MLSSIVKEASTANLGIVSLSTLVKEFEEAKYDTTPNPKQTIKSNNPNDKIILELILLILIQTT